MIVEVGYDKIDMSNLTRELFWTGKTAQILGYVNDTEDGTLAILLYDKKFTSRPLRLIRPVEIAQ